MNESLNNSKISKIIELYSIIKQMSLLIWNTSKFIFIIVVVIEIMQSLIPLLSALILKEILDFFVEASKNTIPNAVQRLIFLVSLQISILVFAQLLSSINEFLNSEITVKLSLDMQIKTYTMIDNINGLAPFENSQLQDSIQLAVQGAHRGPTQLVGVYINMIRSIFIIISFVSVLFVFNIFMMVMIIISVFPQIYIHNRLAKQRYHIAYDKTHLQRKVSYYSSLIYTINFIKEIKLYNTGRYFINKIKNISLQMHNLDKKQRINEIKWQGSLSLLGNIIAGIALFIVALSIINGNMSIGSLSFYTSAVGSIQAAITMMITNISSVHENILFFDHFRTIQNLPQPLLDSIELQSVPRLKKSLVLKNISFRYSGNHPWILQNVNLTIPANTSVALVGLNGAGKTTLLKLLMRFYDPDEGCILWDDIDIRSFNVSEFRSKVGAIFQDFVRYELTAAENIGIGNIDHIDDDRLIRIAAQQVGINQKIESLPHKYDTILSRRLVDSKNTIGSDLSGGEWQKIALARMFMRNADFIVLDEPTASLDAAAEYDLFNRSVELVRDRTCLMISHRFTTVRMASIIAVLHEGSIREIGSHSSLLEEKGLYAELFQKQVEQYGISV